jgi:predicted O-methyltransferase YrrM
MSYGLIEYLMGLDLSGFELLELGGGFSTEFWSARVKSLVTLETDAAWARTLSNSHFPNTEIRTSDAAALVQNMRALERSFDAVIVDASANRYRCAKAALEILRPGGFILLDNSDWYPNTTAMLRQADLIQVDFHDFRPLRWYRAATSLFLHKEFRARPRQERLPLPGIGGKDIAAVNDWDRITD